MKKKPTIIDGGFEKKEQILDVAEHLFSKNGFAGTSIRELAKEAGINIAMISYYFGSKENLYLNVIERKIVLIRQYIGDAFPNGASAWEKLYYIIETYVDRMSENRDFMNLMFSELAASGHEGMIDFMAKRFADNQEAFKSILDQGVEEGVFRQVDTQLAYLTMMGPMKLYVSNPFMVKRMMKETTVESCYSAVHRDKMKIHIKELMTRFLKP